MHYIAGAITAGFCAMTVFVFPSAFIRIGEGFRDVFNSILVYFIELFEIDHYVAPTVDSLSVVPLTPFFIFPETWGEFVANWHEFWELFVLSNNLRLYTIEVIDFIYVALQLVCLVAVPLGLVLYLLFKRYLKVQNNDYNKDSKILVIAKLVSQKVYIPVKTWVISFLFFLREHSKWLKIWVFIWLFNFNVITIVLELVAYYFYFVVTFNLDTIYKQFYKLFCDMSVMFAFIPALGWVVIGYLIFCYVRKKIGYKVLNHHELKNRGFINSLPIVVMNCGTMGSSKTTILTDMALSQEVMFIDKALDLMLEHSMKFPHFPWIELENLVKQAVADHEVYSLATCRRYVAKLYGEQYQFNYDYVRYGTTFDDKLRHVVLWESIESYAQLYFLYTLKTSLLVFNYSVRTDNVMIDSGNFPLWDTDCFHRNSSTVDDDTSRYAHVIDFDAMRLGKKVKEDNPNSDFFEFGVVGITEIGKERGNMPELQDKKKTDDSANQKNDLFDSWLKMIRHSATVDYYPFARVFTDEQRPESLGANARELCNVLGLRDKSDVKLACPGFFVMDLLYQFLFSKFINVFLQYRHNRSDNTLFFHLCKTVMHKLYRYYTGMYNTFGYRTVCIDMEIGAGDKTEEHKYYLSNKKIYSKRFSTDAFSDFFTVKALRSKVGLNDIRTYKDVKATFQELASQNSYFIDDLTKGLL